MILCLKFIYSEKATKFYEIFTFLLSYVVPVKSKVKISQNFVTFSKYMNFTFVFSQGIPQKVLLLFDNSFHIYLMSRFETYWKELKPYMAMLAVLFCW